MAVSPSATGLAQVLATPTITNGTSGITVNSGDNLLLLFAEATGGSTDGSAFTATWDVGGTAQPFTNLKDQPSGIGSGRMAILGLLNPTAGAKTITISGGGTGTNLTFCLQTYLGVDTSSIANAVPSANRISNTGATSITVGTATGHMAAAICCAGVLTGINNTSIYVDTHSGGADSAAARGTSSTSVTFSLTGASASPQICVGVDIAAAAAGSVSQDISEINQSIKRASYW